MIKTLKCLFKGHTYDIKKYRYDLEKHYTFNRELIFKSREEIENFFNDHPLPFCLRCKRVINKGIK